MENKFYFFFFSLLLSGLVSARAQDSSACNAGFTVSVAGSQAYFRAADSLPGVLHQWNFGDSTQTFTGNIQVTHTYSHAGAWFVTQIVTDSVTHCQSISSQTVYITGNSTPTCNVSISVNGDTTTHLYNFVANPWISPGVIDTVTWTINGAPAGQGDTLNRKLTDGLYNVCATISTSLGCRVQTCVTVGGLDSMPSNPPPPDSVLPSPPDTVLPNQPPPPDSVLPSPPDSVQPSAPDSLLQGHFISSYPNPATTQANLVVTLNKTATIYIRVYNSVGSEILSASQSGYPGSNLIVIPVANLPTGIYYVQLQYGNTIIKSKIQKI
jgi:Secretion system C-terminal sorting domain/PKD domain